MLDLAALRASIEGASKLRFHRFTFGDEHEARPADAGEIVTAFERREVVAVEPLKNVVKISLDDGWFTVTP